MNSYLIPANSKRGTLLLGIFRPVDMIIFSVGFVTSVVLLLIFQQQLGQTAIVLGCVTPVLICGLLVSPVPNYHNVLNILVEMYEFFTNRQKLIWKGWCFKDVAKEK